MLLHPGHVAGQRHVQRHPDLRGDSEGTGAGAPEAHLLLHRAHEVHVRPVILKATQGLDAHIHPHPVIQGLAGHQLPHFQEVLPQRDRVPYPHSVFDSLPGEPQVHEQVGNLEFLFLLLLGEDVDGLYPD